MAAASKDRKHPRRDLLGEASTDVMSGAHHDASTLQRVAEESILHPPTAEEAAELEAQLAADPDDLPTRIRLYSFLANEPVRSGCTHVSKRMLSHVLRFVREAPFLPFLTTSTGLVSPEDIEHGQLQEAWRDALRRFPDNIRVLVHACQFYCDWDLPSAARAIAHALDLAPGEPHLHSLAGYVHLTGADRKLGEFNYAAAAAHFEKARGAGDPGRHLAPGLGATAALEAGMSASAEALAHEALKQDGYGFNDDEHLGWTTLGRLALSRGDLDKAHECLRASIVQRLTHDGPSLRLAREVARAGSVEIVAEFLNSIRSSWGGPVEKCDAWLEALHAGDFEKLSNPGR
jgi:uncharacterized protein HemY